MQDLHDHYRDRNTERKLSRPVRARFVASEEASTILDKKTGIRHTCANDVLDVDGVLVSFDRMFYFLSYGEWPAGLLLRAPADNRPPELPYDLIVFPVPRIPLFDLAYTPVALKGDPALRRKILADCRLRPDGRIWVRDDRQAHKAIDRFIKIGGETLSAADVAWIIHHGDWPKHTIRFRDGDVTNRSKTNLQDQDRRVQDPDFRRHDQVYRLYRYFQRRGFI